MRSGAAKNRACSDRKRGWTQHLTGETNRTARDKFDVYFNIDNGTGPIYGFFLENSEAVRPIFDAWLTPFKNLGARRNVIEGVGATDHLSFIAAGVPGFNPIQNYENYDIRTHHTNMDTPERLSQQDIRQAAIVMASFAYQAAVADRKIPGPLANHDARCPAVAMPDDALASVIARLRC